MDSVVRLQVDLSDFKKKDFEVVYKMYYAIVDILPYSLLINYHVPHYPFGEPKRYTEKSIHASRKAIDGFHGQEDLHVLFNQQCLSLSLSFVSLPLFFVVTCNNFFFFLIVSS